MNKLTVCLLCTAFALPLHANSFEIIGTIPKVIKVTNTAKQSGVNASANSTKVIYLQRVRLSSQAQELLKNRLNSLNQTAKTPLSILKTAVAGKVNIEMKSPVLDQGVHGSCVTFANTGAINEVIAKGNYVSQLCSLELGSYLESVGKIPYSGWDGSYGTLVLTQLKTYGVVPLAYQLSKGCAGVKQYPLNNPNSTGKPMTVTQYKAAAVPATSPLALWTWGTVISSNEVYSSTYKPAVALERVKANLRLKRLVTFGMLLDENQGDAGAVGKYLTSYDTWMLTKAITADAKKPGGLQAGHELIITGYDDNAITRAPNGETNKGLFTLRNSWGTQAGNGGTYYVSYQYFMAFCDEAAYIVK